MTTIAEVRGQIADICSSLPGWSGALYVGDRMNSGVIVVSRPPFDPRMVLSGGKTTYTFRLAAYAARTPAEASEAALDALCEVTGTTSLTAALQNELLWGSVDVDYAQVVLIGATQVTTFGLDSGIEYLACPFDLEVVF